MVRKWNFGPFSPFSGPCFPHFSGIRPKSIFRPFSSPFRAGGPKWIYTRSTGFETPGLETFQANGWIIWRCRLVTILIATISWSSVPWFFSFPSGHFLRGSSSPGIGHAIACGHGCGDGCSRGHVGLSRGGFCCSAPTDCGRGQAESGGTHTHTGTHHTHKHTGTNTHTHTQERTRECCTYPLATYPFRKCPIPWSFLSKETPVVFGVFSAFFLCFL